MELLSDILLAIAALGAGAYCHVLSNRLKRFNALENGMGGAIAVLSQQVDEMTRALDQAQLAAQGSTEGLKALVDRAEGAAARLDLLMATLHDLPESEEPVRRLRFVRRRRDLEAAE
ncbi:hypothetical protein C0V75_04100 [Tabrizicola sp. TH137]|uniref:hypothetical protein n=1 Tax=Tabrizicola sp. TH137 TaxID=2067452 RepID=UPI000C7AE433|nr:hypothetical protein [Tabrizicola sp. TH137]PLL14931.1 hypothetical protein C0V75_04100 [Tabrizicola sp. TH137]